MTRIGGAWEDWGVFRDANSDSVGGSVGSADRALCWLAGQLVAGMERPSRMEKAKTNTSAGRQKRPALCQISAYRKDQSSWGAM